MLTYINYPTSFDCRQTQAALEGTDIRVPPLEAYADKLWDYWERHLDPDLFRDRTLVGASAGGRAVGGDQIIEQQIPDELLRLGGGYRHDSLEQAVRGRVVMVTGASSGSAARPRSRSPRPAARAAGRPHRPRSSRRPRRRSTTAAASPTSTSATSSDLDDIERMAEEVLEEHGHVDVLVNNAGRSIRRSVELSYDRFHDFERTMQLNYFGAVRLILKPAAGDARAASPGHIINISSIGVQTNTPRFSAYVASKAALDAF